MSKQITAIIVGAGHRAILYSLYALEHPDELKIVGVADPDPIRRKKVAEMHGFGRKCASGVLRSWQKGLSWQMR